MINHDELKDNIKKGTKLVLAIAIFNGLIVLSVIGFLMFIIYKVIQHFGII